MQGSKFLNSLRGKITAAYVVIVIITIILGLFSLLDLLFVERQVAEGEVVYNLNGVILEMRRNEKYLFLYSDQESGRLVDQQVERAMRMLRMQRDILSKISSVSEIEHIEELLQQYRKNLQQWNRTSDVRPRELESKIREQGHEVSLFTESLSKLERKMLETAIRKSRWFLSGLLSLIGLMIYVVGHQLIKHTVTPLKQLERQLAPQEDSRFKNLIPPSGDREFITLTTAFNQMLKELEIRQKRMMHSEKLASLGILASGVAHELNNPLSNISTSCQLLTEELEEADREQLYIWLRQIDRETERGRKIVASLLDFGRHKSFATNRCELAQIVNDTMMMIQKMLRRSDTQLDINIPEQLYILVDSQRIQQMLINLVQNALNAGGKDTHVIIDAEQLNPDHEIFPDDAEVVGDLSCLNSTEDNFVKITVSDNGPGISHENLTHVFDPFFTTNQPGRGVGLGLYIVREIVNEHNGCLAISSHSGKGTQVKILLPQVSRRKD